MKTERNEAMMNHGNKLCTITKKPISHPSNSCDHTFQEMYFFLLFSNVSCINQNFVPRIYKCK